ncbi:MAG: hypothetical protein PHD47_02655 [Acholeplasmataceae bacterium]|nr:hypothetical protein [Acholeplasmataceae bacterium]
MTFKEKKSLVSILVSTLLIIAYIIFTTLRYQEGHLPFDNYQLWAITLLAFGGIYIISYIVIHIIFYIVTSVSMAVKEQIKTGKVNEIDLEQKIKTEMNDDEMDKIISLKAQRVSSIVTSFIIFIGVVLIAFNLEIVLLINMILFGGFLGNIAEELTKIYYFKRGVSNV